MLAAMKHARLPMRLAAPLTAAVLGVLHAAPAPAATTASFSISDSASTLVGSVSTSVRRSSDSFGGDRQAIADGEHRIVRAAPAADAADVVQLTLRPLADDGAAAEWLLRLPRVLAGQPELAAGQTITSRAREYGYEFAAGAPRRAFFLALHDDWLHELRARPVGPS